MGKRQIRVFQKDIFSQRNQLVGKNAQVVLGSQATFYGTILNIEEASLQIRDMRLKKHRYPLTEVTELVLDYVTTY